MYGYLEVFQRVPLRQQEFSVKYQYLDVGKKPYLELCECMKATIKILFLPFAFSELLHPPTSSAFDNSNISIDADTTDLEHVLDTHSDSRDNEVTSGTLSSPDISDHELHVEDLSHDDSAEHIECRERRDSGVGSSLTRTSR